MTCNELLRSQSYLDGELQDEAAAQAERHIQSCAECRALSEDVAGLSDLMRAQATRHRAPAALRASIGVALAAERRVPIPRGFWTGAASGAGASLLAAGLALFAILPPSAGTLAQSVTDAHTRAMMQGRVIAVVSSSHHTVKPWFAGKVSLSPPVADFAADGFVLMGGRVDEVAGAQAAAVVYRHGAHVLDLFAWADRGAPLSGETMVHGYRVIAWRQGDLDLAAVSDMDAVEMRKFVALVRRE